MTTTMWHFGTVKVLRWGNGLGLKIPLALARRTGLAEGSAVTIRGQGRRIILEPRPDTPTLEELLGRAASGAIPEEVEWRRPHCAHVSGPR